MEFYSVIDIEMGVKRFFYRLFNSARGKTKTLIWDSRERRYIGHLEMPSTLDQDQPDASRLADWIGYGNGSDWGASGW